MTCTCPFAKEGSNCKHMYALLLKIKCNYTDKKLKKEIKKGLKELKQIFKDFDRDSILFKYKNPEYSEDINNLKKQMKCFRSMYEKILENSKNDKLDLIVIKDIRFDVMEFDMINVKSPYIKFYNKDVQELNQHELVTLKKVEEPLSTKRLQLIDTLKLVKEKCEKENDNKLNQIKYSLVNIPITNILK